MAVGAHTVQREVLRLGFQGQLRAIAHGALLAALTVVLLWPAFPAPLLIGWLCAYLAVLAVRAQMGRAFLARDVPDEELARWARRSWMSLAATGLLWGTLGAIAIELAPTIPLYALWIGFLIILLGVLQAYTGAALRAGFMAFLACGMGQMIAASILLPSPHYWLRLALELVLVSVAVRVALTGSRYFQDSVRMRFENIELLHDVTEQKEALAQQKDELDRANAAKTRFLAAASHDLRQPMQALALLIEGLQDRVSDPATRRIVESAGSSVAALSALLNEILDISRFDSGTVSPVRSSFPIARVLERLRGGSSYVATQRDLSFRIRPCDALVETDEIMLYRVLANLVDNALRYTQRGGVLIACRRRAKRLRIEVWDTGIGIPADQLDAIFLEFHQVGNPQRDRQQGLGLGLAIVERACRVLGLTIDVRSRPGRGSVFAIEVPYGERLRLELPEGAPHEPLEGCRVLVVEDDREIRDAMAVLLEGWRCRFASTASVEGIDAALEQLGGLPDMILADYRLPGGRTGLEAIASVRSRYPRASAAMTTGDVTPEALRDMQAAGHPILHKPIRPARLRALLGAAMRARAGLHREPAAEDVAP